jgi:hypothetical protein
MNYLVSVLNSSVSDYYFFQITAKIAGGRKRYTKQYVEQIPIPFFHPTFKLNSLSTQTKGSLMAQSKLIEGLSEGISKGITEGVNPS